MSNWEFITIARIVYLDNKKVEIHFYTADNKRADKKVFYGPRPNLKKLKEEYPFLERLEII